MTFWQSAAVYAQVDTHTAKEAGGAHHDAAGLSGSIASLLPGQCIKSAQCANTACILWPYRGHRGHGQSAFAAQSIRAYCLLAESQELYRSQSAISNTPLHPYSSGTIRSAKRSLKNGKIGQVNRFIEGVWACPEVMGYKARLGNLS